MSYRIQKWDIRFLNLAKEIATWSKDPSTKVGCVITKNVNQIVSLGYNGFPRGDEDLISDYFDRQVKYTKIIHAEENAINHSIINGYSDLKGCTVYTYPFQPCKDCASRLTKLFPDRIVSLNARGKHLFRWRASFDVAKKIFEDNLIDFKLYPFIEKEQTW